MARSCGIRLGPRRYEIVVLEGNAKSHQIAAFKAGEFDPHAADPLGEAASVLKAATKELGVPREQVGLVIDSGHAAFRRLSMPFSDRTKIEQVIKFEIESQLPQWTIDDVVVDYHVLAESSSSADLLVTAVPKDGLQAALDLCEEAGIEPFEAELETSAMVNAACTAAICNIDDAQLLVHIGDYSTSVVVMDAGEVREMRVIHLGALTHEVLPPAPAEAEEGQEEAPPEAGEGDGEGEGEGGEPAATPPPAPAPVQDPIEASRRVDQAITRIRREIGRTISGARTVNPIEAIYVCGMELPGLVGSTVLDVPVYILDCFEEDSGQPADGFGSLVVAYGAAVRELGGGPMSPHLRREELRYTGTWERIEFPFAVACLLLVTLLGVIFILQRRELGSLDRNGSRFWLKSSNNFVLGDPKKGAPGHLYPAPQDIRDYAAKFADGVPIDPSIEPTDALKWIDGRLRLKIAELKKDLGQDASIEQPQSALVGAFMVLDVLEAKHVEWRPSIRKLKATTMPARGNNPEYVRVVFEDIIFLSDDQVTASQAYEDLRDDVEAQEWYLGMPLRGTGPVPLGIQITGLTIDVNVATFYDALQAEALVTVQ